MFVAEDIHFEAIVNADLLDEGGHQPFLELEKREKEVSNQNIIGKKIREIKFRSISRKNI